jgi:hypothetical protein
MVIVSTFQYAMQLKVVHANMAVSKLYTQVGAIFVSPSAWIL